MDGSQRSAENSHGSETANERTSKLNLGVRSQSSCCTKTLPDRGTSPRKFLWRTLSPATPNRSPKTMQTENQNRSQKTPNNPAGRGWMRRLVRCLGFWGTPPLAPKLPPPPAYPTCHHCKGKMTHTMLESWCSDCGFISTMNGCGWPHEGDEDDLRDSPPNAKVSDRPS